MFKLPSLLVPALLLWNLSAGDAGLPAAAESVNRNLWSRFMSPDSVLYDYAGPAGEVDRYRQNPTAENREKVKRLAGGLYRLQDVGKTPGFIARGIGTDGECHYAASSNDQVFPWFLGLWSYWNTDIPTDAERAECAGRMARLAGELEKINWLIPGDMPDFTRGWWLGENFCSAVHLSSVTRIMYEVTKDEHWKELHYRYLNEPDRKGVRRRDRIAAGMDDLAPWSAWFNSNAQYAVRELYRLETDPALRELYRKSLRTNAEKAVPLLSLHRKYDTAATYAFTPDWHRMMPPWREQKNERDAQTLALEQIGVWDRACPAIAVEKASLKPAICAGYIIVLSEQPELIEQHWPQIEEVILRFNYDNLLLCGKRHLRPGPEWRKNEKNTALTQSGRMTHETISCRSVLDRRPASGRRGPHPSRRRVEGRRPFGPRDLRRQRARFLRPGSARSGRKLRARDRLRLRRLRIRAGAGAERPFPELQHPARHFDARKPAER